MADSDMQNLIDSFGEGNVKKAFWLQDKIREEGLDGIHFMRKAENNAESYAPLITYQAVRSELIKRL